jgi:hypothetical protein
MKHYQLWTYDVWGNKKDGFEVNDRRKQCIVKLPDAPTDKQIKRALYDSGVFGKGIMNASLDIDGESDYTLYVNHTAQSVGGFKPLCELECITK